MIDEKLLEVLTTLPDSAFAIVTQGLNEPHVVNSWNSYVQVSNEGKLLIPAGRMIETEKNIERDNKVKLTITNREVMGKAYKGTGFLIRGTANFIKEGPDFEVIKAKYPWARASLTIKIESLEQTL
jgi:predicted pyridoxine 5'-phosphate oxidase superfamily flavin-nucleotide-binding protein